MREILTPLTKRFWELVSAVSVRTKIMGMVLGSVLLLGVVALWQVRALMTATLSQRLEEESITIGRDLAARATDLILLNDLVGLQRLLDETISNNPDIRYAFILDRTGQVLVHTFGSGFPLRLLEVNTVAPQEHHHTVLLQTEEGLVWDTAVPIFERRAGIARVGLSDRRLYALLQELTLQMLLTIALVSALGIVGASFLTWVLMRPIRELVQATQAVQRGDFSLRLSPWAKDEIGELAEAFSAMTEELGKTEELRREREALRRQLLESVIRAQEEERRRISRELHDSTSQNLTSLMVGLRRLETLSANPEQITTLTQLRALAAQTLEEVHEIATRLRPRLLDDLGLAAALELLTQKWQEAHQIQTDTLIHIGTKRLPGEVESALYRIIQEALTNIARHAEAHSVSVLVERRGNEVIAIVEDDGRGLNGTSERGLGLLGMRERAELLGGKLTIESTPGHGTTIHVQIPLKAHTP